MEAATIAPEAPSRPLTIGAVCRRLKAEFPDISISKIRYLEDQGLLTPRRTQGGYRLFTEDDVERRTPGRRRASESALRAPEPEIDLATLCERASVDRSFVRDLEDFGLVEPRVEDGENQYPERDVDVVTACARLARYGVEPRNLRAFRTGADRGADLLEQLVSPALRSRNPERRHAGLEDLESLAAAAQELSQYLFWRALRSLAAQ
ncbi:MAG: MerR family DNA-binding transcriptional regulator [Actinobacteria bacterium]|nr:MAG: MerR family DNA-binding transcriptional regulator [Actinomycetota bacterium]